MAVSTTKKVRISRFDREALVGFVNPQTYLRPSGVELLTPDGNFSVVPYDEVKTVQFVKDFEPPDPASERKVFSTRPKMDGLWVRVKFRDGEVMDGILANNLLLLEAQGFTLVPPGPLREQSALVRSAHCTERIAGARRSGQPFAAAQTQAGGQGANRPVRLTSLSASRPPPLAAARSAP